MTDAWKVDTAIPVPWDRLDWPDLRDMAEHPGAYVTPSRAEAAGIDATRRLVEAIAEARQSAERWSKVLTVLTVAVVALTVALVIYTATS
jgi:hypothetical protein